jgi:hypothetical protein
MLARVIWILVHRTTQEPVGALDGDGGLYLFATDAETALEEAHRLSVQHDLDIVAVPFMVAFAEEVREVAS